MGRVSWCSVPGICTRIPGRGEPLGCRRVRSRRVCSLTKTPRTGCLPPCGGSNHSFQSLTSRVCGAARGSGLDDVTLLVACAEPNLTAVAFDRATLPWHAAEIVRAGDAHGGLILFRRTVRSTDLRTTASAAPFWVDGSFDWDCEI